MDLPARCESLKGQSQCVAVVVHGYVLRILLAALAYVTLEELPKGEMQSTGYMRSISNREQFAITDRRRSENDQGVQRRTQRKMNDR